uniref:4-hydroxyphenylpyruvate dioxygenase n=1 Tax=Astyanax mexicanus TaxID=7994 RepID=A0A8B9JGN5_ASTMX
MAARVCRLHHVSLHVSNAVRVAGALASRFQFVAVGARVTARSRQLALRKGSAVFVVNERRDTGVTWTEAEENGQGYLYDVRPCYAVDSACNVCFEVEDVTESCARLSDRGCDVLVPPTEVCDPDGGGSVTYSVIRSVVGNVCHTLLDRSRYQDQGGFLPGFQRVGDGTDSEPDSRCPVTHFDHVTFACPRRSTGEVMKWYQENFGFQRFFIGRSEPQNLLLMQDMLLRYCLVVAKVYLLWFSQILVNDWRGQNQVDTFLKQHRGPGIQHIGLSTQNIVSTAETMAQAGVEFFTPPPAYYTEVGKQQEILEAGHHPKELKQHGILLDTDLRNHEDSSTMPNGRYLLQVFTKPLFSEDTFFLELIERRGATGFGEGNIRALWRSVQSYMEKESCEQRLDSEVKTKQTRQH